MPSLAQLIENIRTTGEEWARKRRELAALQNRRKALHIALRDRAIRAAAARGEKLSLTAAAEDARAHPE
jgi:alpha-D-ribose 1-methylphosphonate 5-triphosphate synthase subunit PhnI